MRLTVEKDRETIKRYGHIRPAPAWGGIACAARSPGTARTCTLEKGHRGPHVAHGFLKKVVAVWDAGTGAAPEKPRTAVGPRMPKEVWTGSLVSGMGAFWSQVVRLKPAIGDVALLILFLGFVVFAVDWFLRIF